MTVDAATAAALTDEAKRILQENDRGGYTAPSAVLYPFQWNWDSLFVALGWAQFDLDRAWLEIDTLLKAQWPSGMVPHIVFWSEQSTYFPGPDVWRGGRGGPESSGISQPPAKRSHQPLGSLVSPPWLSMICPTTNAVSGSMSGVMTPLLREPKNSRFKIRSPETSMSQA